MASLQPCAISALRSTIPHSAIFCFPPSSSRFRGTPAKSSSSLSLSSLSGEEIKSRRGRARFGVEAHAQGQRQQQRIQPIRMEECTRKGMVASLLSCSSLNSSPSSSSSSSSSSSYYRRAFSNSSSSSSSSSSLKQPPLKKKRRRKKDEFDGGEFKDFGGEGLPVHFPFSTHGPRPNRKPPRTLTELMGEIRSYIRTYTHTHTHIRTHTAARTHARTHTHTHTHSHSYIYIYISTCGPFSLRLDPKPKSPIVPALRILGGHPCWASSRGKAAWPWTHRHNDGTALRAGRQVCGVGRGGVQWRDGVLGEGG
jgi:hypothetical protein